MNDLVTKARRISSLFKLRMLYFAGVAKGITYCGAESPPVRDPFTWSIKISTVFTQSLSSSFIFIKVIIMIT